jgi:hypothetical protein
VGVGGGGVEAAPYWRLSDTRSALISAGEGGGKGGREGVLGGRGGRVGGGWVGESGGGWFEAAPYWRLSDTRSALTCMRMTTCSVMLHCTTQAAVCKDTGVPGTAAGAVNDAIAEPFKSDSFMGILIACWLRGSPGGGVGAWEVEGGTASPCKGCPKQRWASQTAVEATGGSTR